METHQEKILTSLLRTLVVLGSIAYIPSMIACLKDELYLLAAIDTLAYFAHINIISRRIAAISAANELILSHPENRFVDLSDILGSFLRPGIDQLLELDWSSISTEKLTETAVGLSDIFAILQERGPLSVKTTTDLETEEKKKVLITIYPHTPFENREELERRLGKTLFPADSITIPASADRLILTIIYSPLPGKLV